MPAPKQTAKRERMEKISIRIPKDVLSELDVECFLSERSRGFHIKKALIPHLRRQKRDRAKKAE